MLSHKYYQESMQLSMSQMALKYYAILIS